MLEVSNALTVTTPAVSRTAVDLRKGHCAIVAGIGQGARRHCRHAALTAKVAGMLPALVARISIAEVPAATVLSRIRLNPLLLMVLMATAPLRELLPPTCTLPAAVSDVGCAIGHLDLDALSAADAAAVQAGALLPLITVIASDTDGRRARTAGPHRQRTDTRCAATAQTQRAIEQ
ncbi:hypothetical protein [Pseudomonas peli]|uniref:hypothetical protein n=1 Tax=Pseudomonas peli TaxID=592361 RepID=UPI0024ADA60E|nr:hypothetical protein [Pseudomonas peli]